MIQDIIEDKLRNIWENGNIPSEIIISHSIAKKWEKESGISFAINNMTKYLSSGWQDIPIKLDDNVGDEILLKLK